MANEQDFSDHLLTTSRRRHCMVQAANLLPKPDCPVVYFLGGPCGHIKIGFASDIRSRMRELQVGNPEELTLYAYWPGTMADEALAHKRFYLSRIRGEWFSRSGDLIRTVMSLQAAAARRAGISLSREAEVVAWPDDDI